jgi:RNA polymerase sigma-70 factor (ECF subfamily)
MQLPFDQRRAIVLVDVMGYPYEEAARIAETSPGTIKSRIHRGREKLRTIVRRDPELFGLTGR